MSEREVHICNACGTPCVMVTDALPEGEHTCERAIWTTLDATTGSGVLYALMHEQIRRIAE